MLGFFRIFAVKLSLILHYPTTGEPRIPIKLTVMRRYFILTALCLFMAIGARAQDDDMYFTPKKGRDVKTVRTVPDSRVSETYDYSQPSGSEYTYGTLRDVDEYNRRDRFNKGYAQHLGDSINMQDSIMVSRQDYENSMRMKRFDGFHSTILVVNDPWYYDPWYYDPWYYDSFYWHTRWHDPWYWGYHDPWRYHYYHTGWYGWGGWHGWYRPVYHRPIWHGGHISNRGGGGSGRWATTRRTGQTTNRTYRNNTPSRTRTRQYNNTTPSRTERNTTTRNNFNTQTTPSRSYSSGSSSHSYGGSSRATGGGGGSRSYGGGGSRGGRR